MMLNGVKAIAPTAAMLMFAILFFGIMIDVGLFDPVLGLLSVHTATRCGSWWERPSCTGCLLGWRRRDDLPRHRSDASALYAARHEPVNACASS
jgi:hypothetical protein